MRRAHDRFTTAGRAIVVVGQGTPDQTGRFVSSLGLGYPVLADPERDAYAAYGLSVGGGKAFLNPRSGLAMLRAVGRGAGGGRIVGDPRELGGAFVIDRVGIVRLSHPARFAGDSPSIDDVLAAG